MDNLENFIEKRMNWDDHDFINAFNINERKMKEYQSEMFFIKETYKKYQDTHQMLFKIEGKLLNIDKTLDHYEKTLYNLYVELYELQTVDDLRKKLFKISKKKKKFQK